MRIGLDDIDPQIAIALIDRLCAPPKEFLREDIHWKGRFAYNWQFHPVLQLKRKREPNADERVSFELRKKREEQFGLRIAATIFGPIVAGAAIGGGLSAVSLEAGIATGLVSWIAGIGAGVWWTRKARPEARLRRAIEQAEMRAAFPLLTLTRAERVYCDTLLLLSRIEASPEAAATLRDTLRQINTLLESSRQLEQRRLSLLPVLGSNSIPELEIEYAELQRRLDLTTDSLSRQSLQQSLQMCFTRLENAKAFEQGLERLKTQEEAILHTLSSVQSAIARMQIAPELQTALAAQEISETVASMNQQTYAVEQAVQEVMTLRVQ